jgi:hypothetical protein
LAFKPVWAAAFFLVPLLTGRWRMALTMLAAGAGLALATLPAVGVGSWLDWLKIGREASEGYEAFKNWIDLSRDLAGAARRWMLDFDLSYAGRRQTGLVPTVIGWGLLLAVAEMTVRLTLLRGRAARAVLGPGAGFLLLGAWLSCYHFMYYDVLLAALPAAVVYLSDCPFRQLSYWVGSRTRPPALLAVLLLVLYYTWRYVPDGWKPEMQIPYEQYLLVILWLWCGWCWTRSERAGGPLAAPA